MNVAEYDTEISDHKLLSPGFEELYLNVRNYEKRTLSDAEVSCLPDIDTAHIHYREWQIRKLSSEKLVAYLKKKNRALRILEIGCGNGWLAAKLADIANARVIASDINEAEISQAKRVFKKDNLEFIEGGFELMTLGGTKFDVILFAASLPYFAELESVLRTCLSGLTEKGEIHILDTHFYEPAEIDNAIVRMENYYQAMGYPEMSDHYFHYTLDDIARFNYKILTDPRSLVNRVFKKEPFYWISIKN